MADFQSESISKFSFDSAEICVSAEKLRIKNAKAETKQNGAIVSQITGYDKISQRPGVLSLVHCALILGCYQNEERKTERKLE